MTDSNATETLTDAMTSALMTEAGSHGDEDTHAACQQSLEGDHSAMEIVAEVITNARAQDNSAVFVKVVAPDDDTHYDTDSIAKLEHVVALGKLLREGDSVEYVDDGQGSGGYVDGCGDDRDWGDIKATLRGRDLRLVDIGGHYEVQATE